jgi:hypothetical protein
MLAQTDLNLVNNPVTDSVFLGEEAVVGEPWVKMQFLDCQTDKISRNTRYSGSLASRLAQSALIADFC